MSRVRRYSGPPHVTVCHAPAELAALVTQVEPRRVSGASRAKMQFTFLAGIAPPLQGKHRVSHRVSGGSATLPVGVHPRELGPATAAPAKQRPSDAVTWHNPVRAVLVGDPLPAGVVREEQQYLGFAKVQCCSRCTSPRTLPDNRATLVLAGAVLTEALAAVRRIAQLV